MSPRYTLWIYFCLPANLFLIFYWNGCLLHYFNNSKLNIQKKLILSVKKLTLKLDFFNCGGNPMYLAAAYYNIWNIYSWERETHFWTVRIGKFYYYNLFGLFQALQYLVLIQISSLSWLRKLVTWVCLALPSTIFALSYVLLVEHSPPAPQLLSSCKK